MDVGVNFETVLDWLNMLLIAAAVLCARQQSRAAVSQLLRSSVLWLTIPQELPFRAPK